jgi:hypothetical protein
MTLIQNLIEAGFIVVTQENEPYIVWRNITIAGTLILSAGSDLVVL